MNRWITITVALLLALAAVAWTPPRTWAQAEATAPVGKPIETVSAADEDTPADADRNRKAEEAEENKEGEGNDKDECEDDRAFMQELAELAAPYLVTVATRWKEDKGESPDEYEIRCNIDLKMSTEAMGLALDPTKGWILTQDNNYETRFIESVRGITSDGKEFPLRPYGFYLDLPAAVYQTDAWPGVGEPLKWFDGDIALPGGLHHVGLVRARLGWDIVVALGGVGPMARSTDRKTEDEWTAEVEPGLVFDDEARPLGFTLPPVVSLVGNRFPWRGGDLLKASLVTFDDFEKAKAERLSRFGKFAHEVKIVYRQPEEGEDNLEFEGEDRTSLTQYYYGYAVSPRRIVVPVRLEKIYIQRFKKITVRMNDQEVPAKFLGAFLNFGCFMVETEDAESPAVLPSEWAQVPDIHRAVMTYLPERKFGGRRDTLWYNRISGYERQYKDELWPKCATPLARGTLVMDFDGRPIGLAMTERRPEEEKKGAGRRMSNDRDELVKMYLTAKLADAFAHPEAHFDPNLRPTDEREEKRLVWLGVETQPVTPELAEILDEMAGGDSVQKLTRRGEIGLRVTYVYAGSPAEKAGIRAGMILLEIQEEDKNDPIELKPLEGSYRYRFSRFRSYGGSSDSESKRSNYLTKLLTRLGPGTKVTVTYLDGTEKKSQDFVLEWAPYDYSSAAKYKDEKSGLTVKDLTYDIRAILRLDASQPGVICAKVEPGEKASVAQIQPPVILTEINGRPIANVEDYQKRMEEIQAGANGGVADIKLLWMGKNRMVRLTFP